MIGSIEIKTRPLKLAFLVEPNKGVQVRKAIQLASSLWGGMYFPIIPIHARMPATWRKKPVGPPPAKQVVLGYIDAFDPDVLIQMSSALPDYIKDTGLAIVKPEEIWKELDGRSLTPRHGIGIFEILGDVFDKHFKYKAKYPVEVLDVRIPSKQGVFWASVFGEYPEALTPVIQRRLGKALDIQRVTVREDNFIDLLKPAKLFPRRLSTYGTNSEYRRRFRGDAIAFFLDATKVEDITDFWNLRAIGKQTIAVPKQLLKNEPLRTYVIEFLKEHRRHWSHDKTVCNTASFICSRSSTMDEMSAFATSLNMQRPADDPSNDGYYSLQHWYPRIWDEWAREKDGAVPADIYGEDRNSIDIGETESLNHRIPSLLPKFAADFSLHTEARCANEISFRFYGSREPLAEVFPRSTGQKYLWAISEFGSYREWRAGRNGLIKLVKRTWTSARSVPTAEEVFFAWLSDRGWEPQLSPPGLIAKHLYKQARGYTNFLANEKLLGLLEHMNGGTVHKDGGPAEQNVINQERDVGIGEVKNRLKIENREGRLHDSLVEMGAFKMGLRVACPECLRDSWYPLERVRDSFECPRCLSTFPAIGNLSTRGWSYKTAGPFSIPGYGDGAYAVLLTLQLFDDRKLATTRATPVMSFKAKAPGKQEIEADLAMFWQQSLFGEETSGLLFAECKTYGTFEKKDFDRMSYLAKTFPGAVLVFSSLRKSLTAPEKKAIARLAKAGRRPWKAEAPLNPVLVLTGTELLDFSGPPYCWSDDVRERFRHSHGLMGLCDATQQLYLGLPSWDEDHRKKWERRRARAQAKQAPPKLT